MCRCDLRVLFTIHQNLMLKCTLKFFDVEAMSSIKSTDDFLSKYQQHLLTNSNDPVY